MIYRFKMLVCLALMNVVLATSAISASLVKTTIQDIILLPNEALITSNRIQELLNTRCHNEVTTSKDLMHCEQFNYLGKSRKLFAHFQHNQLSVLTIENIRDYSAELTNMLKRHYGEATTENMRYIYFKTQGICLDYANASIHFLSPANINKKTLKQLPVCLSSQALNINKTLTSKQWIEDLTQLDQHIRKNHVSPFWLTSETEYANTVTDARRYFELGHIEPGHIEEVKAFAYFEKMIAHLSDGHAYIANKTYRYGTLPISFAWFGDELIIKKATEVNSKFLAARVTHIGGYSIKEASELLSPYIPSFHKSMFKNKSQFAFRFVGILYAAGIITEQNQARFTLTLRDGKTVEHVFKVMPPKSSSSSLANSTKATNATKNVWVSIDELRPAETLLNCVGAKQLSNTNQCVEYLTDFNSVYFRYGSVREQNHGDIKRATELMATLVDQHNAERIIIDVRNNWGGNSYLNSVLLNGIISNASINQRGKLYLLTNHNTFSAAINFSSSLAYNSNAILIGESYADAPVFPGESGPQAVFKLEHSNALVSLSFSHWQSSFQFDQQSELAIDIPVKNSIDDMLQGYDRVLHQALTHEIIELSQNVEVASQSYHKFLGRYDYSADKSLEIKEVNGKLFVLVEGEMSAELGLTSPNTVKVLGRELAFTLKGDRLVMLQDGKKIKQMARLKSEQYKPMDLLLKGQYKAATLAYKNAYKLDKNNAVLSGNKLGILASKLRAKYNNENLYTQLHNIAVALHGYPVKSWEADENDQ